jgi:cytoskeletal protein CcmA (bactofilin family)
MNPTATFSGIDTISQNRIDQDVVISGMAKITDNLECKSMNISGTAKVNGYLVLHGELRNSGMFKAQNNVQVDVEVKSSGTMNVFGEYNVLGNFRSTGVLKARSNIHVQKDAKLTGMSKIFGDFVVGNAFENEGMLKIRGNLFARDVSNNKGFSVDLGPLNSIAQSTVDGSIVASGNVLLKNIRIHGNVFGRNITLGRNAQVDGVVYYVENISYEQNPNLINQPQQITADKLPENPLGTQTAGTQPISSEHANEGRAPKFCPQCGAQVASPTIYCEHCGFRFD